MAMAPKKRKINSKGTSPPPPPALNPRKFISRVAEEKYDILSVRPFVPDWGFLRNNPNFHAFLYTRRNWKKLCKHPNIGIDLVVSKFHANLRDRIGSTIFVRGVSVPFDSMTINRFFELEDEDKKEYRAL